MRSEKDDYVILPSHYNWANLQSLLIDREIERPSTMETVRAWMSFLGSDTGSVTLAAFKNSGMEEEGEEKWQPDIVKNHRQRTEEEEKLMEMGKANAMIDDFDRYFMPTVKSWMLDQ